MGYHAKKCGECGKRIRLDIMNPRDTCAECNKRINEALFRYQKWYEINYHTINGDGNQLTNRNIFKTYERR